MTRGTVWANSVVFLMPPLDEDLSLFEGIEDFAIEQFITHFAVEAFDIAVFPRAAWRDEERRDAQPFQPLPHRLGGEFGAVVQDT